MYSFGDGNILKCACQIATHRTSTRFVLQTRYLLGSKLTLLQAGVASLPNHL